MNTYFERAKSRIHDVADRNSDGKIDRTDALLIIAKLQHEAGELAQARTPLGAMLIVGACAFGLGVLARMIGFPWVF